MQLSTLGGVRSGYC